MFPEIYKTLYAGWHYPLIMHPAGEGMTITFADGGRPVKHLKKAIISLGLLVTVGSLSLALNSWRTGHATVTIFDRTYQSLEWSELKPPLSAAAKRTAADLSNRIDKMSDSEIRNARKIIEEDGDTIVASVDNTDVSIEGFLVPIDFDLERTSDFVLVPYYGACIHVPPPASNQIVFVKFKEGLAMSEFGSRLETRFRVDGRISATAMRTDIADVGYQMIATKIEKSESL